MAKRKVVKKAVKTTRSGAKPSAPKTASQEALEVTWVLKGHLKNAQISYIRVGCLLAQVRGKKLYEALHCKDMETYAEERLNLGRASLYRYLQVHDWISEYHKEWLEPKPQGFIPELSDATDLIWIERKLAEKDLSPATRTQLEALRSKALDGKLRQGELDPIRRKKGPGTDGLKSCLSKLRLLRRRGAQLASMPPEAISKIDAAVEIIENAIAIQGAGAQLTGAT